MVVPSMVLWYLLQPMILPLFDTFNELELLARLAAQTETDAYSIVKSTFKLSGGRDFNRFLSDGLLSDSAYGKISVAPSAEKLFKLVAADSVASSAATLSMDALELRFTRMRTATMDAMPTTVG